MKCDTQDIHPPTHTQGRTFECLTWQYGALQKHYNVLLKFLELPWETFLRQQRKANLNISTRLLPFIFEVVPLYLGASCQGSCRKTQFLNIFSECCGSLALQGAQVIDCSHIVFMDKQQQHQHKGNLEPLLLENVPKNVCDALTVKRLKRSWSERGSTKYVVQWATSFKFVV